MLLLSLLLLVLLMMSPAVCDFDENQQKRWIQSQRHVYCVNDYYGHGQEPLEIRALQLSQQ